MLHSKHETNANGQIINSKKKIFPPHSTPFLPGEKKQSVNRLPEGRALISLRIEHLVFEFWICFEFRDSDFGFKQS